MPGSGKHYLLREALCSAAGSESSSATPLWTRKRPPLPMNEVPASPRSLHFAPLSQRFGQDDKRQYWLVGKIPSFAHNRRCFDFGRGRPPLNMTVVHTCHPERSEAKSRDLRPCQQAVFVRAPQGFSALVTQPEIPHCVRDDPEFRTSVHVSNHQRGAHE